MQKRKIILKPKERISSILWFRNVFLTNRRRLILNILMDHLVGRGLNSRVAKFLYGYACVWGWCESRIRTRRTGRNARKAALRPCRRETASGSVALWRGARAATPAGRTAPARSGGLCHPVSDRSAAQHGDGLRSGAAQTRDTPPGPSARSHSEQGWADLSPDGMAGSGTAGRSIPSRPGFRTMRSTGQDGPRPAPRADVTGRPARSCPG